MDHLTRVGGGNLIGVKEIICTIYCMEDVAGFICMAQANFKYSRQQDFSGRVAYDPISLEHIFFCEEYYHSRSIGIDHTPAYIIGPPSIEDCDCFSGRQVNDRGLGIGFVKRFGISEGIAVLCKGEMAVPDEF